MTYEDLINKKFDESVAGIDNMVLSNMEIWFTHVNNLPIHLRVVYTVVILHQQVFNGGFHQYFFNAYGMFAYLTIDSLEKIKANYTIELLKKVLKKVNDSDMDIEVFKTKVFNRKLDKIVNFDEDLGNYLDSCDDEYYETEENLTELLGQYLENVE